MSRLLLPVGVLVTFAGLSAGADDPYDQSKVPLELRPPADFKGKTVLLVAGSKSHGPRTRTRASTLGTRHLTG